MFSAFQTFGRLGAGARAVAAAWTPAALWPTGTEPGMWIDPSNLTSQWQDSTGTTPVATPGTVADTSNPVGLALDIRAGATVLTDPGNHLLQATSTARPLLSGRVNLLRYTEDFSNAVWTKELVTATTTAITETTGTGLHRMSQGLLDIVVGGAYRYFVRVKRGVGSRNIDLIGVNAPSFFVQSFILSGAGTVGAYSDYGGTVTVTDVTIDLGMDGYYTCGLTVAWSAGAWMSPMFDLNNGSTSNYTGDGVSSLEFDGVQLQFAPETAYQAILTDGSTYPATGFHIFQKYDGTDDGMATASFAAGTLTSAMDCMIAVRRGSGTVGIAGLSDGAANNKFFGFYHDTDNFYANYLDCGTPTTWVDGVQLTGGTATTRAALYTALADSGWHVAEWRGLDLSGWTAAAVSAFVNTYRLNGAQGGILLFPSSTSAADRDAARTWLGAKVGLTL